MRRALSGSPKRWVIGGLVLVAAGLFVALAQDYGDDPPAAPATSGASAGVFTLEQAERGAALFSARCSGCHGAELTGGFGPRLAPLGSHWRGQTLGSLFRFVSSAMPYDKPGSLETEQYLDAIAFVLQRNGYPAGANPLVADPAALDPVLLDDPPPTP
ncbi:MAG TPA: c-type cytochrome [Trueperaceae bacterium]|nr:c-type cytochrome [Trueperaceae bacterium]